MPAPTPPSLLATVHRPSDRRRLGRVSIDPTARPLRVRPAPNAEEVFLEWEGTLDDAGRLRRCPVCGCKSLYRSRSLPALTPFVVILAFAGTVLALLGFADDPRMLAALVVVLLADIAILLVGRTWLVCYQCSSRFRGLPIARQHRRWDRAEAERVASNRE
jgi:DNA-directed RNA polymerase subunit RPC12/RpoP